MRIIHVGNMYNSIYADPVHMQINNKLQLHMEDLIENLYFHLLVVRAMPNACNAESGY